MAFTDEQKLNFAKQGLKTRIMAVEDWTTFKSLVANITPAQFKNLIKSALADQITVQESWAAEATTTAADYTELHTEVNEI